MHDTAELCEGVGRRVPPPGRDEHALLDRDPPQRAAPVARQGPHSDGLTPQPYLLRLIVVISLG